MGRDPNFDEKLEFVLSKHMEHFSPEEFAMICNSLVATDSQFNDLTLEFTSLLKEAVPYAILWLNYNAFSLSDLPSVVVALSQVASEVEEGKQLQVAIENCIQVNAKHLKAREASYLVQAVHPFASADTIELLDRVIGNN